MKKLSPLIILSLLLLSGCGVFGGGGTGEQANITPNPPPQPTPEGENQEEVPQNNTATPDANSVPNALIPSTNPKERLNQITQGRGDPFGSIRPPAVVRIPVTQPVPESAAATKAILREQLVIGSDGKPISGQSSSGKPPKQNLGLDVKSSGQFCKRTQQEGGIYFIEGETIVRPPKEAYNISVLGILGSPGRYVALVKTPDNSFVQTIKEGDFVNTSSASIFVDNINVYRSGPSALIASNSTQLLGALQGNVTFIQNNQSVVRRVGEPPVVLEEKNKTSDLAVIQPKGPDIFGISRGLLLTSVNVNQDPIIVPATENTNNMGQGEEFLSISGTLCNDNSFSIFVEQLDIQIENTEGLVLSASPLKLSGTFVLKPGQQGVFDGSIKVRQIPSGEVSVKLRDWEGNKYKENTW